MLADNIIKRSIWELITAPLEWFQIAPVGYLFITKVIALLTGYTDWGFRLPSYLCGIIIPPFFYISSYHATKNRFISFLFSLSVCVNPYLMFYSTELKPYILDVLLGLSIFSVHTFKHTRFINKYYRTGVILFFIFGFLFFSYYYILSLSIIIYLLFFSNFTMKERFFFAGLGFAVTSSAYLILAYKHPYTEFMNVFWQHVEGFINLSNVSPLYALKIVYWKFLSLFRQFFIDINPELLFLTTLALSVHLLIRRPKFQFWLMLPFVIHTSLAILNKYPFTPRLSLLWLIYMFILFVISITQIRNPILKHSVAIMLFVGTLPLQELPQLFFKPIVKSEFIKKIKYIPKNSTVFISESLVPLYNVEVARGHLSSVKDLTFILGKFPSDTSAPTSQMLGILLNKHDAMIHEITGIKVSPLYVILNGYNENYLRKLSKELSSSRIVSTIIYHPAYTAGCHFISNSISIAILKLEPLFSDLSTHSTFEINSKIN